MFAGGLQVLVALDGLPGLQKRIAEHVKSGPVMGIGGCPPAEVANGRWEITVEKSQLASIMLEDRVVIGARVQQRSTVAGSPRS